MKKNSIDDKVGRTMKCMMIGSSFYNVALLIIVVISTIMYCKIKNIANAETINPLNFDKQSNMDDWLIADNR